MEGAMNFVHLVNFWLSKVQNSIKIYSQSLLNLLEWQILHV